MSPKPSLTVEERVLELERMTKCLAFAADIFTLVGESFEKSEHSTARSEVRVGEFGIEQFDAVLKKHNLLCANYRQELLLDNLGRSVTDFQVTTCGIWDFAHLAHHVIFDEDLPK